MIYKVFSMIIGMEFQCSRIFEIIITYIYSDLMTWVSSMQALVSSQEVASDVASAETLLNRHKVYTVFQNFYCVHV